MSENNDAYDQQYVKTHLADAIPITILVAKETLDGAVYD